MRKSCIAFVFLFGAQPGCRSLSGDSPPGALSDPSNNPDSSLGAPAPDLADGEDFATAVRDAAEEGDLHSPSPENRHVRCGWIGAGDTLGESSFVNHSTEFDVVHPKWFTLGSDGKSVIRLSHVDWPSTVATAKKNGVRLMPLIDSDDATRLRLLIHDPARRSTHIAALVETVEKGDYAGMDIDYEHLWSSQDRADFVAFMTELSTAFHAHGFELSMALPTLAYDDGNSAYDWEALSRVLDVLHMMGYDFHSTSSHLGPIAPKGWIEEAAVRANATGRPERFLLGLANYAIGSGWYTTSRDGLERCSAAPAISTDHMATCPFGHFEAGRAVHCQTSRGEMWVEDLSSMEEKIVVAKAHGFGGVTYWTLGDELPGYFEMVRNHYP
jgi:spore germination protein